MKNLLILLFLVCLISGPIQARSDLDESLNDWNAFYIEFDISGYPVYDQVRERYDFFDLDDNYRGSLCYNNITEQWEYLGL